MARKKQVKRADNRFEYKGTIGKDIHGKAIRKSFYSTVSQADAKRQFEEYKISLEVSERTGEAFIASTYTFEQWAEKWLETYKKPFVLPNTFTNDYLRTTKLHLIPHFGAARLTDIKPADIQGFFASKKTYSKSLLDKMKMCLQGIFETAIENDICFKNPMKRIQISSTAQKHEKQVYTDEEIQIVKTFAAGRMDDVILLLNSGLRRGELLGLMWSDYYDGALHIQRAVAEIKGKVHIKEPKWESYRTVPLCKEAQALLDRLPHNSLYIFPDKDGGVQVPHRWSRKLATFMRQLHRAFPKVPELASHELRHTYGTMLRRKKVDIYTIQKILGHKDIKVTTEIYVHNEPETLKEQLALAFEF